MVGDGVAFVDIKSILHPEVLYGFYSEEQAKVCGTTIYEAHDGREVEVTTVSQSLDPGVSWDDIVLVSRVRAFVRVGREGELGDDYMDRY